VTSPFNMNKITLPNIYQSPEDLLVDLVDVLFEEHKLEDKVLSIEFLNDYQRLRVIGKDLTYRIEIPIIIDNEEDIHIEYEILLEII